MRSERVTPDVEKPEVPEEHPVVGPSGTMLGNLFSNIGCIVNPPSVLSNGQTAFGEPLPDWNAETFLGTVENFIRENGLQGFFFFFFGAAATVIVLLGNAL